MKRILLNSILLMIGAVMVVQAAPVDPPAVGTAAPPFTLTSGEGGEVSLSDYKGKWLVLYFYPRNFTGGCTIEAHEFQQDLATYEEMGAVVVGVSVDSAASHQSFCVTEGLTFTLLSDPDAAVSKAYGSANEKPTGTLSARNTFIIDPDGTIAGSFIGVKPSGHSAQVLELLGKLQAE